jgi:hypothetical protein
MTTINDLSQTMNGWLRWMRIRRAAAWALRGLILGLALGLGVGLLGLLQSRLLRAEFLALVAASALVVPLLAVIVAYLWPIQPLKAARYFDRVFHLNERVSTALELNTLAPLGAQPPTELTQQQLDDAVHAARMVKPTQALPLRLQTREALLALIFALLIGLTWFQGETLFQAAQQARAVQQAAAVQEKKIEQILTQIDNNKTLSEDQKKALSEPLKQAQQGLKDNPSQEGAVSVLTSAGEKLQALTDPQAQQAAQVLKDAGSQAAAQDGSPLQSTGEKLAQGNTAGAASDLANTDVSKLSKAQQQDLAKQLDSMSQSLAETNPQLSTDLKDAAQALKNGDNAKAQQALNKAAQSMAQAGQQQAMSQQAGQAAQQMQQGAGQMLAAGGGNQQQAGQPGQGQQGQGQPGQQGSGQNGQANGTGATGSGQGSSQGSAGTGQSGSSAIQPNGPGDGGESAYEQIYAPNLLGGNDGQTVTLPNSGQTGGETVGQGPTKPGDPGQSLVPYQQVYSQYDQSYHQAIENGSIPFEFLEAIRNYFDSLKP